LRILDHIPLRYVLIADVAADLHVVKRQIRLAQIRTDRCHEIDESLFKHRSRRGVCIGFALIPKNSLDLAIHGFDAADHRAIERIAVTLFQRGAPLAHRSSAVSARKKPNRNPSALNHIDRKRQAKSRAFLSLRHIFREKIAGDPLGLILAVQRPVDAIDGVHQRMQGLFGNDPIIGHVEAVNQRRRLLYVDQVADALHVRLAGQNPKVAHQDSVDG